MELIVTKTAQADNLVAYGPKCELGKGGQQGAAGDLRNAEGDATKLEDVFNLPTQLKQLLVDAKWIGQRTSSAVSSTW